MISGLFQPPALLGVDLGPAQVRLIQLGLRRRRRSTHYCVEACATQPVQDPTPGINYATAVSRALRQAVQHAGTRTRQVAVALSASDVVSKTLTLPAISADEMVHRVRLEAAEQFPFPMEEAALDFVTLGPSATSLHQVEVLLVAARREAVDQCVAIVEAADLNCQLVDSLPLVMQRAYQTFCQPQTADDVAYALLDTNHHHCHLFVFMGDILTYQQSTPATADQMLRIACEQLQTHLHTETPLTGLWLAGPCAGSIAEPLSTHLNIPIAFANPFIRMTLRSDVPVLSPDHEAPCMLTACSLALRRFDLHHGSY
ncbi:MAG: pilus assembly protein PilM [Pseudomonadota bacterium]